MSGESADLSELHARVRQSSASPTDVEEFADRAMAELAKVRATLAFTERLLEQHESSAQPAAMHTERQTTLLLEQNDELIAANNRLEQLTALCDLAEWSAQTAGVDQKPVVRVDEIRRVLA